MKALRKVALRLPDTEEGVACEGTPAERRTVKARKKAFVFLGVSDVMVKLDGSIAEARRLAAKEPSRFKVGTNGWVKATFDGNARPPLDVLERWIEESYGLITGRGDAPRAAARAKVASAKTPSARKPRRSGRT